MEDFRKELIVLLNFKCMRQIEIQFQVLKNKRVSKCVRDTDDTRIKVSKLVMGLFVATSKHTGGCATRTPSLAACCKGLFDKPP